jgi:prepilin-type N-terminal cleavage/methylation domain-containing protein/prepilin-type processing-associated H-X9-DG protein
MSRQRSETRRGFTLVELLVVIAIIAILVSLLLPAVNSAREAARRVQCQNNIRNLALSVLNYESANGKLPPSSEAVQIGSWSIFSANTEENKQMSWLVRVLPFLEEQALHDQIDFGRSIMDQALTGNNTPWYSVDISIAQCPSDAAGGRLYRSSQYTPNIPESTGFAKINYATYVSPEHARCQRVFPGALINKKQSIGKIKDGTSKTIVLAEVRTRDSLDDERGAWAWARPAASLLALDLHSEALGISTSCDRMTPLSTPYSPLRTAEAASQASPPNNPVGAWNADQLQSCNEQDQLESDLLKMPCDNKGFETAAPRSLHNGGVNTAHLDGSVRFITDEVEVALFATLISINDGTALSGSLD